MALPIKGIISALEREWEKGEGSIALSHTLPTSSTTPSSHSNVLVLIVTCKRIEYFVNTVNSIFNIKH
jgi:hypothetical protein